METTKKSTTGDIEAGGDRHVDLRWAFVRKVYVILALQLLLTVAVATVVILVAAIPRFIVTTNTGVFVFLATLIAPFIVLFPLFRYANHHPVNLVLLTLFTVLISFAVGLSCSFSPGKVVLLTGILTSMVVVTLTLYTFWAAARGHDFSFLRPFLMVSLLVLMVFALIQIFIPFGKLGSTIFGLLMTIVFSGFIIYDTNNLIKRFKYNEYILASISLYLDIMNLFLGMLGISGGQ